MAGLLHPCTWNNKGGPFQGKPHQESSTVTTAHRIEPAKSTEQPTTQTLSQLNNGGRSFLRLATPFLEFWEECSVQSSEVETSSKPSKQSLSNVHFLQSSSSTSNLVLLVSKKAIMTNKRLDSPDWLPSSFHHSVQVPSATSDHLYKSNKWVEMIILAMAALHPTNLSYVLQGMATPHNYAQGGLNGVFSTSLLYRHILIWF